MADQHQLVVRDVDRSLWQQIRAEAVTRGVTAGALLNEIMLDWLGQGDADRARKVATITVTLGDVFPGGNRERIYRLRAGRKGTGRILAEMGARDHGSQHQASDAAEQEMEAAAERLDYRVIERES